MKTHRSCPDIAGMKLDDFITQMDQLQGREMSHEKRLENLI